MKNLNENIWTLKFAVSSLGESSSDRWMKKLLDYGSLTRDLSSSSFMVLIMATTWLMLGLA